MSGRTEAEEREEQRPIAWQGRGVVRVMCVVRFVWSGQNSRSYFLLGGASCILISTGVCELGTTTGQLPTTARGTGGAKVEERGRSIPDVHSDLRRMRRNCGTAERRCGTCSRVERTVLAKAQWPIVWGVWWGSVLFVSRGL